MTTIASNIQTTRMKTADPIRRAEVSACVIAVLAASLTLVGCSTPTVQSSVEVPSQFASAPATTSEPEVAWWESFGDPVLSDLIRRAARENRDVRIAAERVRAARAGETISRSWLFPSVGVSAAGLDYRTGYHSPLNEAVPDIKAAGGSVNVAWEVDLSGRLRSGAAAAAADTLAAAHSERGVRLLVMSDVASNYLHPGRRAAPARDGARDRGRAGRNAAPRFGAATCRSRDAVRCRARARTDASQARAAVPPLETLAAVSRHRIAVLIGDQAFGAARIVPVDRPRDRSARRSRANPPNCSSADPTCSPRRRSSTPPPRAGNRLRRSGFRDLFLNAPRPAARAWSSTRSDLGATRFTNVVRSAGDADLQRRPDSGHQRDRPKVPSPKPCSATSTVSSRALEDVENALVALAG
jgi:multidrug efflux system outer membrane protein